jgi:DNA-binding GntR family transcriptional regulator
MARKIEPQTQSCYSQLRRLLLYRQIQSGSRLTEVVWSERLTVNRSALREALNMLAHEGLLCRGEGGGFFVPVLEKRDLEEILEVRLALELGAIRLLAKRGSAQGQTDNLRKACQTMEQMFEAGLELGFEEGDRQFHEVLLDSAGNGRLSRVYQQAPLPVVPSVDPDEAPRRKSMRRTLDEHWKLCDLLDAEQYKNAADLLERHLMTSYHLMPVAQ